MRIDAIVTRRSIRKFRPDAVPLSVIQEILEAARVAPSGKNDQPWEFVVLGGEEKERFCACMEAGLRRETEKPLLPESHGGLADAWNTLRMMRQAPITIAVLNRFEGTPFAEIGKGRRIGEIIATQSIGAAIQNMLLKAEDLGNRYALDCKYHFCLSGIGRVPGNGTSACRSCFAGVRG